MENPLKSSHKAHLWCPFSSNLKSSECVVMGIVMELVMVMVMEEMVIVMELGWRW